MADKGKGKMSDIPTHDSFAMTSPQDARKETLAGCVRITEARPELKEPQTPEFVNRWLNNLLDGSDVDPFVDSSEDERIVPMDVAPIDSAMVNSTTTNPTGMMAGEGSDIARSAGLRVTKMMGLSDEELYRLEMKRGTVEEGTSTEVARARQKGQIPAEKTMSARPADVTQMSSLDSSDEEIKYFTEREMAKIMKTAIIDSTRARKAAMMAGDLRSSRLTDASTEVFQERVDEIEERPEFIAPYSGDEANEIRATKKLKSFHELPPPRVFETAAAASARLAGKACPSDSTTGDGSMLARKQKIPLEWSEPSSKSEEDDVNVVASTPDGLASASHLELAKDIAQLLGSVNIAKDAQSAPSALDRVQEQQANTTTTHTASSAGDGVQQHQANEQSTQRGYRSRSRDRSNTTR